MKLTDILNPGLNAAEWTEKGYELPKFDVKEVVKKTHEQPTWVHFGAGNIFRGFIGSLSQRLLASGDFTTASALAFLVFILLYMPCIATVAAIGAEAGWKWAAASVVYNTTLAWFVAWIVYRIALIF